MVFRRTYRRKSFRARPVYRRAWRAPVRRFARPFFRRRVPAVVRKAYAKKRVATATRTVTAKQHWRAVPGADPQTTVLMPIRPVAGYIAVQPANSKPFFVKKGDLSAARRALANHPEIMSPDTAIINPSGEDSVDGKALFNAARAAVATQASAERVSERAGRKLVKTDDE